MKWMAAVSQAGRQAAPVVGRLARVAGRVLGRLQQPGFWTTLLMIGLIALVGWELTRERLYVEPFGVPPALAARGYSAEAVPSLILDQVAAIQAEAQTRKKRRRLEAEWRVQDIEIPGVGLSIRPLVRFLRSTLGLSETRVQGTLLCRTGNCAAGEIAITLRVERAHHVDTTLRSFAQDDGSIDHLLRAAARFLLREIDPYVLAAYLYQSPPEDIDADGKAAHDREVLSLVELILARGRPEDRPYAESLRGLILSGQGDQAGAIAAYRRFAALDPEGALGATTYVNWAKALAAQGDEDGAFAKLDQAAAIDPDDPYLLATRGELLFGAGRHEEAVAALESALAREPDNAVARLLLAGALERQGETAAAEAQRATAVAADPQVAQLIEQAGGISMAALAVAAEPQAELAALVAPVPVDPPGPVEPPDPVDPTVPPVREVALPPLPAVITPPAAPTDVPPPPGAKPGEPPPEPPDPLVLYFPSGSARLDESDRTGLQRFATQLAAQPALAVSITGHADRVGSDARNEQLSLQRAAVVKAALEALGITAERLSLAGRGESDPAVRTPDDTSEPANRRVVVVVEER